MDERSLVVDDVTKEYGHHTAVSSLSFTVGPGEYVGLLGPNGSGKTTTLHMLAGLIEPTAGSVRIDGLDPAAPSVRRTIGVLPDDLPLPMSLTGSEFLDLHDRLRGVQASALRAELTDLLGLDPHLHRPMAEYSHGMKRKTQIVAAVGHGPSYLLLDEPLRGLDPEAGFILRDLIDLLRARGTGVLIATHDIARAGDICDRVTVLHLGEQVAFDTPAHLCVQTGAADLEGAFLSLTGLDREMEAARDRVRRALGERDSRSASVVGGARR